MRLSRRFAGNDELIQELRRIAQSESRSGSHDDTGAGAAVWDFAPHGEGWECLARIQPGLHTDSHTSVQNSSLEQWERDSGWDALKAILRERFKSKDVLGHRNYPWDRPIFRAVVIAEGWHHYGGSARARCYVEVWEKEVEVDGQWMYEVIHLEHVNCSWGAVVGFLDYPPGMLLSLADMDAFKEYKA